MSYNQGNRHDDRNFQRRGDRLNSGPNNSGRVPNNFNRNNNNNNNSHNSFSRNGPLIRMNPWEPNVRPPIANQVNMNNLGNSNMMGNRPSGGLLPTPTMGGSGLLQQPSIQNIELAVANNVLNALLLPNMQQQQQSQPNQMPSLLNLNTSRGGLLPLNPSVRPFANQNFGNPGGSQGTQGMHDSIGPNRSRPLLLGRRPEPYNKMGNRNQRPAQTNGDRKRSAGQNAGASAVKVTPQIRNFKEQKGERVDQKVEVKSNDKSKEDAQKRENENDTQKAKAAYADIPSDLLSCHICSSKMWDAVSFLRHIKGKGHQTMMDQLEEKYKIQTNMMRHEMKVEEQQRQIAFEKKQRQNKAIATPPREYCAMCNLHFNGNLSGHRKSTRHQALKAFLHPKCEICSKEFATRIEWDQHLLSGGHLKVAATRGIKQNSDVVPKKRPSQESDGNDNKLSKQESVGVLDNTPTAGAEKKKSDKIEEREDKNADVKRSLPSKSVVKLENQDGLVESGPLVVDVGKIPEYDSSKEIGVEVLQEITGYLCGCCNRFLSSSADAKTHCKSQFHYDKYVTYMNNKVKIPKTNGNKSIPSQNKIEQPQVKEIKCPDRSTVRTEQDDEEDDKEDEGNWKRRKVSKEEPVIPDADNLNEMGEVEPPVEEKVDEDPATSYGEVNKLISDTQEETSNSPDLNGEKQDSSEDPEKTILIEPV